MSKVQEVLVLGRVIGKSTGWDQTDTFSLIVYDFVPAEGFELPELECLGIDFENGVFTVHDDTGDLVDEWDIVEVLNDFNP